MFDKWLSSKSLAERTRRFLERPIFYAALGPLQFWKRQTADGCSIQLTVCLDRDKKHRTKHRKTKLALSKTISLGKHILTREAFCFDSCAVSFAYY